MIKVNNEQIRVAHFPDNSQRINCLPVLNKSSDVIFEWKYESDEELVTLLFLVNHLRENHFNGDFVLYMNYVPNGRMDRVYEPKEVFTLKWFCKIINSLKFSKIIVMDPHSNVNHALLNNIQIIDAKEYILNVIDKLKIPKNDFVIYFPDYSAMKKYSSMISDYKYCYGKKIRDWDTGEILGLEIVNPYNIEMEGKCVLMVDDIISYGGTMYFGAKKLKELGAKSISAYASHTENSVLNLEKSKILKAFDEGIITMIYTTDSIYHGNHEKIEVI